VDVGQDDGVLTAQGKHTHRHTQSNVHGAQAKGTVGVGADMTCGRAHTRGCMRYCSPTPTWRADTRQASGKPQRNQVPDQLCDIRRSPARLFSCSLLALLPCLLEYVCSNSGKKNSNPPRLAVPTSPVVSKLSVTSSTTSASAPRHQARDQSGSVRDSTSVRTQSSSLQDIFPTRLTGLVRLSARTPAWTKDQGSALFPPPPQCLLFLLISAAAYTNPTEPLLFRLVP
jgi:hypothetical protein